jgi:hypothetical protein
MTVPSAGRLNLEEGWKTGAAQDRMKRKNLPKTRTKIEQTLEGA